MKILYTAQATVTGGRSGHVVSSDKVLDLQLRPPKEMGGEGGPYSNPEQLFAAGYAACFNSAILHAARRKRLEIDDSTVVTVAIGIGPDGDSYKISADINVSFKGVQDDVAKELMEEAHRICPYSKATRGNIDVQLHYAIAK